MVVFVCRVTVRCGPSEGKAIEFTGTGPNPTRINPKTRITLRIFIKVGWVLFTFIRANNRYG